MSPPEKNKGSTGVPAVKENGHRHPPLCVLLYNIFILLFASLVRHVLYIGKQTDNLGAPGFAVRIELAPVEPFLPCALRVLVLPLAVG